MTKRIIALTLLCCTVLSILCGCSGKTVSVPQGWDYAAEAEKAINEYYEQEHISLGSQSITANSATLNIDGFGSVQTYTPALTMRYHAEKVKFIDCYKGYHIFLVRLGFDQPQNSMTIYLTAALNQVMVLSLEDGHYVVADLSSRMQQKILNRYSICSCDMGSTATLGAPCQTCEGSGWATIEQKTPIDEFIEEQESVSDEDQVIAFDWADSIESYSVIVSTAKCPDCDGLGSTDVTYYDCSLCNGLGCIKH